MASDSVIAYMKPCFDSLQFTGYASELANAYLRKGNIDSAQIYIEKLSFWEGTKTDFYLRNSQLLTLKGDYKEACKSWENAFNLLLEESKFMLSQRLGAINAEYDLLNAELQNEKQRVRTMRIYNTALMVLVVALGIAIVVIKRYKRNIGEKDVDIAKSKERFNALFEKHKTDYPLNKDSVMTDAMHNLKKLHEAYPSLTKTEISIIWLLFMKCSTSTICELLSISQNYYYQRKSVIYKTFGIKGKGAEVMIENLVKEYIVDNG